MTAPLVLDGLQQPASGPGGYAVGLRLGNSGLKQFGGHVYEEFHRQLRGRLGTRVFREMADNDATISGILLLIEYLVRGAAISVEPAGTSPAAVEAAQFLDSCIQDLGSGAGSSLPLEGDGGGSASTAQLSSVLSEYCSTLVYGWSLFEEVFKQRQGDQPAGVSSRYNDNRIGWADLEIRAQDTLWRWEIDDDTGRLLGMWQIAPPKYVPAFIPIDKATLFRTRQHKNNPEGQSYLRGVYRSWYLKKRLEEIEAIGLARDLTGLPYAMVPPRLLEPGASTDDKAILSAIQEMVAQVARDEREGLVVPSETITGLDGVTLQTTGFKFGLMASPGSRSLPIGDSIKRYAEDIARGLLHHYFFLGTGPTGSRALSSDLTDMSVLAVGSILDIFCETLNAQPIPRLYRLNGYPPETWARLKHGDLEKPQIDRIGSFLSELVTAGVITPDDGIERYARDLAGAPQVGENVPNDPKAPSAGPQIDGKQLLALNGILSQVTSGELPAATARAMILETLPLSEDAVDEMLAGLQGFTPAATPPPEPPATGPAPPAAVPPKENDNAQGR